MTKKITVLLCSVVFLGIIFFIYSCSKTLESSSPSSDSEVPPSLLKAAIDWHTLQTGGPDNSLNISVNHAKYVLPISWKSSKLQKLKDGSLAIIVDGTPAYLDKTSKYQVMRKYLFYVQGDQIISGQIVEIYSSPEYILNHQNDLIENFNENKLTTFTGVTLQYDVNYHLRTSTVYKNGNIVIGNGKIHYDVGNLTSGVSPGVTAPVVNSNTAGVCYAVYLELTYADGSQEEDFLGLEGSCGGTGEVGGGSGPVTVLDPAPAPVDPCAQEKTVSATQSNPILVKLAKAILAETTAAGGIEYGANQTISSLSNPSSYINTNITPGTTDSWTPPAFTFSGTTFVVGEVHSHPGGSAPSPDDVFAIVKNLRSMAQYATQAQMSYYMANASVAVVSTNGNYVVTVNNWADLTTQYNSWAANPTAYDAAATAAAKNSQNPTDYTVLYALGDSISLFYAPPNTPNTYNAISIQQTTPTTKDVAPTPCPTK